MEIFNNLIKEKEYTDKTKIYVGSITNKEILENFDLDKTFNCGQCFRWEQTENGYIGVIKNRVLEILEYKNKLDFYISYESKEDLKKENIEKIQNDLIYYFDLKRDYKKANSVIIKNSDKTFKNEMTEAIKTGRGIRILNQDIFETIITYIISANNNIPRIKKIIKKLCEKYGKRISFNNKIYYTFPNYKDLKGVTKEEYRALGAGFRDIRLYETVKKINENGLDIYIKDKESLKKLSGVGDKVAECIMLFSLNKINTFPIDVWVRRVVNDIFFKEDDEKKIKRKDIEDFGNKFFGGCSGLAQEYLFYWRRNF